MTARDPLFPNEKLQLVASRQPFGRRKLQQSRTITATAALPGSAVVVHDLPIPYPNFRPLHARIHHVVTVGAINRLKWVFKLDSGFDSLQVIVNFS